MNRLLRLKICEIFFSLQGEGSRVGLPTVFIRLTGCPLRCHWCDTGYAFTGGENRSIGQILERIAAYPTRHVCVTGGEPLAQKNSLDLLSMLCDAGYDVCLETSGALDISVVDQRVSRIVDIKAPASGESARNYWPNLDHLTARDEIKIVIADRSDYEWARDLLVERNLACLAPVLFSPVADTQSPRDLADWLIEDGLPVRFQLQLHKILWANERGR